MYSTRQRPSIWLPFGWMAMLLIAVAANFCTGRVPAAEPEVTQADRARLKEVDELNAKAVALYGQGKVRDAIPLAKKALAIRKEVLGEKHPDTARSLNILGDLLDSTGDYAGARPLYEQAIAINQEVLGEKHPHTATSLNNLAMLLQFMGDYAAARPLYEQALAIRKEVLGEKHPDTATSLNNLAHFLKSTGDYTGARPLYEQSLAIRKEVLGEKHPHTAVSLNNLGSLLESTGDYAAARPLYEQALAIRKEVLGEKHPSTATSLNNLAGLLLSTADYAAARPLYEQALAIHQEVLGEQHPSTATSLNNLASLLRLTGDYAAARPLFEQVLAIRKEVLGEKHLDTSESLNNLASLLESMGDYAVARPLYEQALATCNEVLGEKHPDTAGSLNNLAGLLESTGDYAGARPLYEQALAIHKDVLGEKHPDTATSLNNLAGLLKSTGDYASARPLYKQALAIRKEVLGEKHPDTARSLNSLAGLLETTGDYATARPLHEQAFAIHKEVLGEKHPDTATSLNKLAHLLHSMGDYAGARPLYEQALAIRKEVLGEKHPDTAQSLNNLGSLLMRIGHLEQAEPLLGQAAQIALDNLNKTSVTQSERQQLAMNESVRFRLDWYLNLAVRRAEAVPRGYELALAWKGAIFVRQHQMRLAAKRPELAPFFAEWQAVSNRLATQMLAAPAPDVAAAWRAEMVALTDRQERLESEMARRSAEFRQLQTKVTPALLRESLPAATALIDLLEYWHWTPPSKGKPGTGSSERRLLAFIVRADRESMISLGPVKSLKQSIDVWRMAVQSGGSLKAAGDRLRELLWVPLADELKGVKTVLLSPDGVVGQFPWPALPGLTPGTYLLEELPIAVVPVPQMLPWMTRESSAVEDESLLVVGEVDYGASSGVPLDDSRAAVGMDRNQGRMVFPDIANNTRREMTAIHDSFEKRFGEGAVTQLRKDEATEAAFRAEAGKRRWLHMATHGYFAPAELTKDLETRAESLRQERMLGSQVAAEINPGLLSGLALTGANNRLIPGNDDGILTALEVASLDLSHVRVTVLSACETGLGRVAGGEGLLGLQRAFQVSGAQTTVASLWKVPDQETAILMSRFYDNLWGKKMSRLAALREAQLWMLALPQRPADRHELAARGFEFLDDKAAKRGKEPPADGRLPPKYWAAFVLSGDWR